MDNFNVLIETILLSMGQIYIMYLDLQDPWLIFKFASRILTVKVNHIFDELSLANGVIKVNNRYL